MVGFGQLWLKNPRETLWSACLGLHACPQPKDAWVPEASWLPPSLPKVSTQMFPCQWGHPWLLHLKLYPSSPAPQNSYFPLPCSIFSLSVYHLLTYNLLICLLSGSSHYNASSMKQGSLSVLFTISQCLQQCLAHRGSMNICLWNKQMNGLDC